jgi:hypothetical protein
MIACNARQTTNSISTYTHQAAYPPLATTFSKVMQDGDDLLFGKTTA